MLGSVEAVQINTRCCRCHCRFTSKLQLAVAVLANCPMSRVHCAMCPEHLNSIISHLIFFSRIYQIEIFIIERFIIYFSWISIVSRLLSLFVHLLNDAGR